MTQITKPMLAISLTDEDGEIQWDQVKYPCYGTPKLDGIRCEVVNGKALSRSFIPIANHFIRNKIELLFPDGFDGEIIIPELEFNDIQSLVMTEEGEPDFKYASFDYVKDDLGKRYILRIDDLNNWWETKATNEHHKYGYPVLPKLLNNKEELLAFEKECLNQGYEGICLRTGDSPYKCGRSTLKEKYLIKFKRYKTAEAIINGFEEQMINTNEAKIGELGQSKRSKCKAGLVPSGIMGKMLVRGINGMFKGKDFKIGTGKGLTKELRKYMWEHQEEFIGKIVVFQYQPKGTKDLPRVLSFKGFRDESDM